MNYLRKPLVFSLLLLSLLCQGEDHRQQKGPSQALTHPSTLNAPLKQTGGIEPSTSGTRILKGTPIRSVRSPEKIVYVDKEFLLTPEGDIEVSVLENPFGHKGFFISEPTRFNVEIFFKSASYPDGTWMTLARLGQSSPNDLTPPPVIHEIPEAPPTPAASVQQPIAESEEDSIFTERISRYLLELFHFRYGQLDPDHLLNRYANQLLQEALGDQANGYHVEVLPHWHSPNAAALPNGTILVSIGLLQFVEYQEEMKAAFVHETTHIKGNNSLIIKKLQETLSQEKSLSPDEIVQQVLRIIGVHRLQEYEADLRWMFEESKQLHVNPLAQVVLLEKLKHFSEGHFGEEPSDLIHGSSLDRILNTESIFYFFDLHTLSRDLGGPLPREIQQSILLETGLRLAFSSEYMDRGRIQTLPKTQQIRLAHEIPVQQLVIALKSTTDKEIRQILEQRVDDELFPETAWPDAKQRALAKGLFYELHVGKSSLFDSKEPVLSDPQDVAVLLSILRSPQFQSLPLPPITASPNNLSREISDLLIEKSHLGQSPNREKISRFISLMRAWSGGMQELYQSRGADIRAADDLFEQAMHSLYDSLQQKESELVGFAVEQSGIPLREVDQQTDPFAQQISQQLYDRIQLGRKYSTADYQDILDQLQTHLAQQSPLQVFEFFTVLSSDLWDGLLPKDENIKSWTNWELYAYAGLGSEQSRNFEVQFNSSEARIKLADYVLLHLFEEAMTRWDSFSFLSTSDKNGWRLRALLRLLYYNPSGGFTLQLTNEPQGKLVLQEYDIITEEREIEYGTNPIDMFQFMATEDFQISILHPNDRKELSKRLVSIEKLYLEPDFDDQEIQQLYTILYYPIASTNLTREELAGRDLFCLILAKHLARHAPTWEAFFESADSLERMGVTVFAIMAEHRRFFGQLLSQIWSSMPQEENKKQYEQIRRLVPAVNDPFLRLRLESYYYHLVWPNLTSEQKLEEFSRQNASGLFNLSRFTAFIEQDVKTEQEFQQVRAKLDQLLNHLTSRGSPEIGLATLLTTVEQPLLTQQYLPFFLACLESAESDASLKMFSYDLLEGPDLSHAISTESEDIGRLNAVIQKTEDINQVLLRMDDTAKYTLLRRMLTGSQGLITHANQRERFLTELLSRSINQRESDEIVSILKEGVGGLSQIRSWKPLYFALQPFLVERTAIPPAKTSRWVNTLKDRFKLTGRETQQLQRELRTLDFSFEELRESITEYAVHPWRYDREFLYYSEELLRRELIQRGAETTVSSKSKLSPLEFIVEIAQHFGALGVRFLQLLPQFIDLTDEEQEAFSRVFDAVEGQNKLASVMTLEREWPEIWDEIASIEEKAGGGSMMTVYRVVTVDGQEEVIKILNPNLEFLLEQYVAYMEELLDQLEKSYGNKYQTARLVLEEVKEWIGRDVNFEGFLEQDHLFRQQNDGFTADGFHYRMAVPQSRRPASRYFIREEYIRGDNLTQWAKLENDGHDMKEIVSLIIKNYVEQLRRGLAHSDVHIGNFRITADRRVNILDRNFSLELSSEVQEVANTLINPLSLMMLSPSRFMDRIIRASRNPEVITPESRQALEEAWQTAKTEIMRGNWKSISQFLVELRTHHLILPLEMTLIFKNLNSLQQMSKRAGFNNFLEAYLYPGSKTISPIRSIEKVDSSL